LRRCTSRESPEQQAEIAKLFAFTHDFD